MFQINRVEYRAQLQTAAKNNRQLDIPTVLDLAQFQVPEAEAAKTRKHLYHLRGVINHAGNAQHGHFYSFLQVRNAWFCISDEHVREWSVESVLEYARGVSSHGTSAGAYCLFYSKSGCCEAHLTSRAVRRRRAQNPGSTAEVCARSTTSVPVDKSSKRSRLAGGRCVRRISDAGDPNVRQTSKRRNPRARIDPDRVRRGLLYAEVPAG